MNETSGWPAFQRNSCAGGSMISTCLRAPPASSLPADAMNVTFHAITGFGISHIAARGLDQSVTTGSDRRDIRALLLAFVAGVLSHGVLDGLKHGYPIPYFVDPPLALAFGVVWCAAVKARYRILFAAVFVAVMLPDLLDLGPAIANRLLGWHLPIFRRHIFPWHWADGSGSLYRPDGGPPRPGHGALDAGDNWIVSATNHAIVVCLAGAAVVSNVNPFRIVRRTDQR